MRKNIRFLLEGGEIDILISIAPNRASKIKSSSNKYIVLYSIVH